MESMEKEIQSMDTRCNKPNSFYLIYYPEMETKKINHLLTFALRAVFGY